MPDISGLNEQIPPGFAVADGSRRLSFPEDFGAHEDFHTEWWYYTGNLVTPEGRRFGFELTVFRVGLLPPTVKLPADSRWYNHSLYFAHFTVSDIAGEHFYAFERYSRPGPPAPRLGPMPSRGGRPALPVGPGGLAGAQADPYHIWIEDWSIAEQTAGVYRLQAAQAEISLDLTLTDEMGIVLHGENGYSRKGESETNASYYYSQPRLRADGFVQIDGTRYPVSGLAWKDHEFSTNVLEQNQIGWDWFSLQFEDGSALMLFQLRERDGGTSAYSSGTFVAPTHIGGVATKGIPQPVQKSDFEITVLDEWRSPHTGGVYPAAWEVRLKEPGCVLKIYPWMADQELHFPAVTYWEGAVHFEGTCNALPAKGNGYIELTGYAGNLPLR